MYISSQNAMLKMMNIWKTAVQQINVYGKPAWQTVAVSIVF